MVAEAHRIVKFSDKLRHDKSRPNGRVGPGRNERLSIRQGDHSYTGSHGAGRHGIRLQKPGEDLEPTSPII